MGCRYRQNQNVTSKPSLPPLCGQTGTLPIIKTSLIPWYLKWTLLGSLSLSLYCVIWSLLHRCTLLHHNYRKQLEEGASLSWNSTYERGDALCSLTKDRGPRRTKTQTSWCWCLWGKAISGSAYKKNCKLDSQLMLLEQPLPSWSASGRSVVSL